MCKHPPYRSAPPGGSDRHQSAPSDSCNFGCQLYNEPVYIGGPGKMPDFSVLQHGAAVMFQYRSKTGTSATELRYAIVGPRGVNAETPHGRPNDTRPGYWMRHFDRERYGPGNSRVKFYLNASFGEKIKSCTAARFNRVNGLKLDCRVMPGGDFEKRSIIHCFKPHLYLSAKYRNPQSDFGSLLTRRSYT